MEAATPVSLQERIELQKRVNEAHDLMADVRRRAKALLDACDGCLEVFERVRSERQYPNLDARLQHAMRVFYRTGIALSGAYNDYATKFLTSEPPKAPAQEAT